MKDKIFLFTVFILTVFSVSLLYAQQNAKIFVQKIIIIRHGEKPPKGDNLSCAGFNRALRLPDVLDKKVGSINAIFVPSINQGKSTGVARMYQTAIPYAIRNNLTVNTKFDESDVKKLADAIKKQTGTVLVIWEHDHINNIAKELGVRNADNWDNDDYDSIWIISFKNKKAILKKEKEGISPSGNCQ